MEDRDFLRNQVFKDSTEDTLHLPVNIPRLVLNCQRQFDLRSSALINHGKTDLTPQAVLEGVDSLIKQLTVFHGRLASVKATPNEILKEMDENALQLMKIYLRQQLASCKVIKQHRFTPQSFEWLIGEIKSRFETSLVQPGEMVGSIAAHSLGEPAT